MSCLYTRNRHLLANGCLVPLDVTVPLDVIYMYMHECKFALFYTEHSALGRFHNVQGLWPSSTERSEAHGGGSTAAQL